MIFEKEMQFLGSVRNEMKDGAYYSVTLFDPESKAPVTVNMMDSDTNDDKIAFIASLAFGVAVSIKFRLMPKDKLYRLQIFAIS